MPTSENSEMTDISESPRSIENAAGTSRRALLDVSQTAAQISTVEQDFRTYREIMKKGSKTFAFAARLFSREQRLGAMLLYSWCRHCDDAIDAAADQEAALDALDHLKIQTERALDLSQPESTELAFRALRTIAIRYSIPALYPLELLNGMEMDTAGIRIRTESDLKLYCYRVASVVGLMMTRVMGVTDARALRHAVDTGLAMQMTNIARDISDDYNMKRIYIPDEWFKAIGYTRPDFESRELFVPQLFTEPVRKLLEMADGYYTSGRKGLEYLPWRAAFAVASAQRIYREIGVRVLKKHDQAWFTRTYVPLARKLILMMAAVSDVIQIKLRAGFRRQSAREFAPLHRSDQPNPTSDHMPQMSGTSGTVASETELARRLQFNNDLFRANDL